MRLKIFVTKEVLEASKYCGVDPETLYLLTAQEANVGTNCAFSKAVCALLPNAWVGHFNISIFDTRPVYNMQSMSFAEIPLPKKATDFIKSFDRSTPEERAAMTPISFEIDVPDSVIEKIGIEQAHEIISKSKTMELV